MKKIIFTFFAACLAMAMFATDVNYTVDNTTIFPNPERGFITMFEGHLSNSEHYAVKGRESSITKHANTDKGSLILVLYYLDEFKATETLPSWVLSCFDEDMAVLREKGMKCILRYAYTNSATGEIGYDAPLSIIEKHLAQYKSHWQSNADVIFCFQAGFIGTWGEWYYSSNFGNKASKMNSSRKAFLDTLLNATPQNRYVQIRTPLFKTGYMDSIYGSHAALTSAEAYTGTAKARLGHHNDAFLYGEDNMGTYSDPAVQKPYIAQETLYVPIGGESDITDTAQVLTDATHERTVSEMSSLHWTFIQSGFSRVVTNTWRKTGTFDTLNVHMGYRYQLLNGSYGDAVTVGNQLSVNMTIKNVGYAPLYNERHAYIVLKNENATYALQLSEDPRTWLPNGATATINENVMIPDTVYNGTYDLYLWLPDAYESIKNDARYAVRFANTGVWDDETGLNALGAQVTVSGGSDAPDTSIPLPATLDKSNVESYSSDMTWYGASNEYFDFGPTSGYNLDRWAEWKVRLRYPGKYTVTENGASPDDGKGGKICYRWKLVLSQTDSVSGYYTKKECSTDGEITNKDKWDLTSVPAGVYKLRVMNVTQWGQPKLKSLTLSYDGDIPSGMEEETEEVETDGQMYDILGRPVDESYRGVIIMRGKKILR